LLFPNGSTCVAPYATAEKDAEAQSLITAFDKERKHTFRSLPELEPPEAEQKLRALHQKNDDLVGGLCEFANPVDP
jgi:hypothetical protein